MWPGLTFSNIELLPAFIKKKEWVHRVQGSAKLFTELMNIEGKLATGKWKQKVFNSRD
jgi:hypothetical protein